MSNPGAIKSAKVRNEKAKKSFIEDCNEVHNNYYDYSKVEYTRATNLVTIICPKHGEFQQKAITHKIGCGCPECGKVTQGKNGRITKAEWLKRFYNIHGLRYDYTSADFNLQKDGIVIRCREHGFFYKSPSKHLIQGCPSCTSYGFNQTIPAILYYLSVNNGQAYKIGITNRTVSERYSKKDQANFTILKIWKFSHGLEAQKEEHRLLEAFQDFLYKGEPLLENGNTELFEIDVLELDYNIQRLNIVSEANIVEAEDD